MKTGEKVTLEELQKDIEEYYQEELPNEFYEMLKEKLSTPIKNKVLIIILKGNIYELISFLKHNNEQIDNIEEFITPAKYFEISKRNINQIVELLKKLPVEENQLLKNIKEEPLWLLKRTSTKTEHEYIEIAYKMYQTIGFENTIELLNQKYGPITYEQIHFMFSQLNTKKGLNKTEQAIFINFLFGNKKDSNNTIRQILDGRFDELFLNFDYFYNNFTNFINCLGTKLPKLKVKDLMKDRFLSHDISTPEITSDILDDMLSSYYCKYETLDTPKDVVYSKNYAVYNEYLKDKYQSSIPRIQIQNDEITAEVLKLNDPRNLVLGYRAGNCFRINGDASILFSNFLKSEHMRLLSLSTLECKDFAMMLIMRNGNVLIGQGIEVSKRAPSNISDKKIYDTCREAMKQIMDYENSKGDEIVATIIGSSNSNVSKHNNQVLPFLISPIFETTIPFYNGIYNYQCLLDIENNSTLHDIKLYIPEVRYYDEREKIFERDYKALNYDEYLEMEKLLRALRFARLKEHNNPNLYFTLTDKTPLYTCCNREWYITLFEDGTIDSYIFSKKDPRVQEEYNQEMSKVYRKIKKG